MIVFWPGPGNPKDRVVESLTVARCAHACAQELPSEILSPSIRLSHISFSRRQDAILARFRGSAKYDPGCSCDAFACYFGLRWRVVHIFPQVGCSATYTRRSDAGFAMWSSSSSKHNRSTSRKGLWLNGWGKLWCRRGCCLLPWLRTQQPHRHHGIMWSSNLALPACF